MLTGDRDRIIPHENSELLAACIPGARLEVIAGAGHLFFLERPGATVEIVEGFLAGPTTATSQLQVQ